MWKTEAQTRVNATAETIWKIWQDVPRWKNWDSEIEFASIDGEFAAGTKGVLKPKGGPKTKFVILHTEPGAAYSDRSFLPLCHLDFYHEVVEENGEVILKHRAEMTGMLSFVFSKIIGRQIEKGMPRAVEKLARLAEEAHK